MKEKRKDLMPLVSVRVNSRSTDAVNGGSGRTTFHVRYSAGGLCCCVFWVAALMCLAAALF